MEKTLETNMKIQPKISETKMRSSVLGFTSVSPDRIEDLLSRNFCNPESPLDPDFRNSISEFTYLPRDELSGGLERLSISIHVGSIENDIKQYQKRFKEIGGSVFIIRDNKGENDIGKISLHSIASTSLIG